MPPRQMPQRWWVWRPISRLSSTVIPLNRAMFWKGRARPRRGRGRPAGIAPPRQKDAALLRAVAAADGVEHAGLAGAVRADDGVDRAALDREAHVVEGGDAAEAQRRVPDLELRRGRRGGARGQGW